MKRKAAVVGVTPQFVRWAIEKPCELRELKQTELPQTTFAQLRSLNELSRAYAQDRVFENVCFAQDTTAKTPVDELLGFPTEEVTDLYGGENEVSKCCKRCVANINHFTTSDNNWAGCYGWLAADPSWRPIGTKSETNSIDNSVIAFANSAIESTAKTFELLFDGLPANWHSLIRQSVFEGTQLEYLATILEAIQLEFATRDAIAFAAASTACMEGKLRLHCEAVPSGFSDGLHWRLDSHCQRCRIPRASVQENCPGCGAKGSWSPAIQRRVLGMRPYLQLSRIFGEEKTKDMLARYLASKELSS